MVSPVHAAPASLSFDPVQINTKTGQTISIDVNMYTGEESVASTDVMIHYDKALLEPVLSETKNGNIFQKVEAKSILPGTMYLYGIQENPDLAQPAQGRVATITFKTLNEGNAQITFDCDPVKNTTSQIIKNNSEFENIINCTSTLSHATEVTITKGSVLGAYSDTYGRLNPYTAIFGILVAVFTFFIFLKYQKLRKGIT